MSKFPTPTQGIPAPEILASLTLQCYFNHCQLLVALKMVSVFPVVVPIIFFLNWDFEWVVDYSLVFLRATYFLCYILTEVGWQKNDCCQPACINVHHKSWWRKRKRPALQLYDGNPELSYLQPDIESVYVSHRVFTVIPQSKFHHLLPCLPPNTYDCGTIFNSDGSDKEDILVGAPQSINWWSKTIDHEFFIEVYSLVIGILHALL